MLALLDVFHNVANQFSVHLEALVVAGLLSILLYCPYCPKRNVWLFHLIYLHGERLAFHELAQSALCGLHYEFKIVLLLDGEG